MLNKNIEMNHSKIINPHIDDTNLKFMAPISSNQTEFSISTEINSNEKIEIGQNFSPKKKPKVSTKIEAIKTFCRIRPIKGSNELFSISPKDDRILNINSANLEKLNVGNNLKLINSYKFSKVFGENSTQEEVFEATCKPLIDDLMQINKSSLIFTYGMTNAGKTFTVIGTPDKPGILPKALQKLLEYDEQKIKPDNINNNLYCNFVEIYNEDVFDLLADDLTGKNKFFKRKLNVKENLNSVFFLQDVTYSKLDNLESFNNILNKGISKKVHSSTNLNQNSSRSHTIFKIILMNKNKDISKIDFSTEELISLSVVDLAGSERQKRTEAKGKNLQEACKINQSLSTLGKCLEAMKHNSISNVKKIVPLRESKLTKIFAEYFQGDQNIIMITNINPRTEDFEETIRALNYSCIAKDIKPMKSVIPKLNSGNELKLQLKREKKMNEQINNENILDDIESKELDDNCNNNFLTEKKNIVEPKNNDKLNDSLTFNLNELFNSNSDDIKTQDIKIEFTQPPEDNSSTKDEIAKLMLEIKKLREEVNGFKSDNSDLKNSKTLDNKLNDKSEPTKLISFEKNKLNYLNNNINPFIGIEVNDNNVDSIYNTDINNNNSYNGNESVISQDYNISFNKTGLDQRKNNLYQNNNLKKMSNMNNMLVPYGNYGYPFNNPFIPFYGANMCNSPFLALPDPKTYNKTQYSLVGKGKKNKKKNQKINDILNSSYNNFLPGLPNRFNLIFINSKFGNLVPGQPIQEENCDFSDSDYDSEPKKKKVKQTPKKKKKNISINKVKKYYGNNKNIRKKISYPKINKHPKRNEEDSSINESDNESNSVDSY